MSAYSARMAEIEASDAARRARQYVDECDALGLTVDPRSDRARIAENTVKGARVNPCLVRGIGTVNPPAPTSASVNQWDRCLRMSTTVGIAPGTEDMSDGTPTVHVIRADGTDEIVPASSFRRIRESHTTRRSVARTTPETARITLTDMDWGGDS